MNDGSFILIYKGAAIIDITNPANPNILANRNYTGFASGLTVIGGYAYLACNDSGLAVIDISDPTTDEVTAYRSLTGKALSIVKNKK